MLVIQGLIFVLVVSCSGAAFVGELLALVNRQKPPPDVAGTERPPHRSRCGRRYGRGQRVHARPLLAEGIRKIALENAPARELHAWWVRIMA